MQQSRRLNFQFAMHPVKATSGYAPTTVHTMPLAKFPWHVDSRQTPGTSVVQDVIPPRVESCAAYQPTDGGSVKHAVAFTFCRWLIHCPLPQVDHQGGLRRLVWAPRTHRCGNRLWCEASW